MVKKQSLFLLLISSFLAIQANAADLKDAKSSGVNNDSTKSNGNSPIKKTQSSINQDPNECNTDPGSGIIICRKKVEDRINLVFTRPEDGKIGEISIDCKKGLVTGRRKVGYRKEMTQWINSSITKLCPEYVTEEVSDSLKLDFEAVDATSPSQPIVCTDKQYKYKDIDYNLCTSKDKSQNYLLRLVNIKTQLPLMQISGNCDINELNKINYNSKYLSNKNSQQVLQNLFPVILNEFCNTKLASTNNRSKESFKSEAYYQMGISKYSIGDPKGAIKELNRAIRFNPLSAKSFHKRAKIKSSLGITHNTMEDYNLAIFLDPTKESYYLDRADQKAKSDNYTGAIIDYNQALKLNPNSKKTLFSKALANLKTLNYDQSIIDNTKVIEIDPKHSQAYRNRGIAYLNLGNEKLGCLDLATSSQLGDSKTINMLSEFKSKGLNVCTSIATSTSETQNNNGLRITLSKNALSEKCLSGSYVLINNKKTCL